MTPTIVAIVVVVWGVFVVVGFLLGRRRGQPWRGLLLAALLGPLGWRSMWRLDDLLICPLCNAYTQWYPLPESWSPGGGMSYPHLRCDSCGNIIDGAMYQQGRIRIRKRGLLLQKQIWQIYSRRQPGQAIIEVRFRKLPFFRRGKLTLTPMDPEGEECMSVVEHFVYTNPVSVPQKTLKGPHNRSVFDIDLALTQLEYQGGFRVEPL